MDFRILGPLEVCEYERLLELGGTKQRALLAVLLLSAGEAVSADRLIEALWGEAPPPSALNSVHIYVSQLRKALGDGRIVTHGHGYLLALEPGEFDLYRFQRLVAEGRQLGSDGDLYAAAEALRNALALWRGPALGDLAYESFAQGEVARLEELRLAACEERIEADLGLGRHAELVPELEALVRAHPLRERLRAQQMLALYRSNRHVEALEAYRAARKTLVNELGLEPSRTLQELERAILTQDPGLDGPTPTGLSRAARRRRGSLVVAAAAAAILLAVGAVVLGEVRDRGATGLGSVSPNVVAVIDPETNRVVAQVPVGGRPVAIATGLGAVWVADRDDATVLRIDARTRRVTRTIGLGIEVSDLAVGEDSVWVAGGNDSVVVRLSPRGEIRATIEIPPVRELGGNIVTAVTVGGGAAWAVSAAGLSRIDGRNPRPGEPIHIGEVPVSAVAAVATSNAVWVVVRNSTVVRVAPAYRATIATLQFGDFLTNIDAGKGEVWVMDDTQGTAWRIDPVTSRAAGSVRTGRGSFDVVVGDGAVWTANPLDGTVSRIDPRTERVVARVRLGHSPVAIAADYGAVWVGVADTPPFPRDRAGPRDSSGLRPEPASAGSVRARETGEATRMRSKIAQRG